MKRATTTRKDPGLAIEVSPTFETDWPGASAEATEIVLNVGWLTNRMLAIGEPIAKAHGLPSLAAFNVLEILRMQGPLTPSAIADRMIVRRQTMTGILDTLERRGLITRELNSEDRREIRAAATHEGISRSMATRRELHLLERQWVEDLTADQRAKLLGMIAIMQASGRKLTAPKGSAT